MLAWLMYVITVSVLLSLAAFVGERTARMRRKPTRWIWMLAIVASLLLPSVMSSVSVQMPDMFTPKMSQNLHALREVTTQQLSPAYWIADSTGRTPQWRNYDPLLKSAWMLVSIAMTLVLAATGAMLFLRKRHWPRRNIHGVELYVTPDVGPAVVGLLHSRIVVPSWVLQASPQQQAMVLAHEQSHLDAGDPQLFTLALCLLVAMPWNLPLWWQLRRLRRAIEVDCDARVLGRGHAVESYGETLIEVGERQSVFIGAVAAMSESTSFLEERIRIMVSKPTKWTGVIAAGFSLLSLAVAAVAVQVGPPNGSAVIEHAEKIGERKQIALPDSVLENYVGQYKLMGRVFSITRLGNQLSAQLTNQPQADIFPQSQSEFFYKAVNAQITFVTDQSGHATGLVLHQNGNDMSGTRIDAAAAQLTEKSIEERIRFQQATPGGEIVLKRTLGALAAGKPNYVDMSPALANTIKQQIDRFQPMLMRLGPVQSLQFKGVGQQGWDIYEAQYQKGTATWRIALGEDGKIDGLLMQQLP